MPITQIPFQDPVAPPEKPVPEQLGLYDARDWETAYRDPDANIPHLLIQLQDDLSRSRRREAAWISIIAHLVLFILLWNLNLIEKYLPFRRAVVVSQRDLTKDKDVTFLALPPDAQKITQKPKTNILSDKNRIATSRHPELDPKELRKILASPPPGAPGMTGPRAPQPAAQPPAVAQNQPAQPQQGQQATHPPSDPNLQARLQMPTRPNSQANVFAKYGSPTTPGQALQQATQGAAAARAAGQGGQQGDFGLGTGAHGRQLGGLEVLSDTMGVDFGPYLERIHRVVQENWERACPESVWMGKKGKLAIEFAIMPDGHVQAMTVTAGSGDVALDRAAWAGITASNPFPPLPKDFTGSYLALRFRFYYNPEKGELEQ